MLYALYDRFIFVDKLLELANDAYVALGEDIFFDTNSDGTHLNKWRTALKSFYNKEKGE